VNGTDIATLLLIDHLANKNGYNIKMNSQNSML